MVKDKCISGIICEFNPFHKGHKHLIDEIKKNYNSLIVCVMSGNYVQRGDCAIIDKWARTKAALENGCDLVIELPLAFALSGAEKFALGGVTLLNSLGNIDYLAFGSESGNSDVLNDISKFLLSKEFKTQIKNSVNGATNFATAREILIAKKFGDEYADVIRKSNNILGIEYIKAIVGLDSAIKPISINRIAVEHDGGSVGEYASASEIRRLIALGENFSQYIPENTYNIIKEQLNLGIAPATAKNAEIAMLYKLRTESLNSIENTPDVSEGLENKIKAAVGKAKTIDELYDLVKSKRYSHARIRRIVLSNFLGITKGLTDKIPYIRVLGMNSDGEEIIRNSTPALPYVFSYADAKKLGDYATELFELEAQADDIYGLMTNKIMDSGTYYTQRIIKK